jgi:hypothetical protein
VITKSTLIVCLLEQTAIVAKVRDEFNCIPVENEEYRRLSEARVLEALKPKRETKFVPKITSKMLQPKNVIPGDKGAFVVSIFLDHWPVIIDLLFALLMPYSKQRSHRSLVPRKTRLPACLRMSSWISSTSASGNTNIGRLRH